MLVTQLLATAFVIVGCCITFYVCIYNCYCIVRGVEVNEHKLMVVVFFWCISNVSYIYLNIAFINC